MILDCWDHIMSGLRWGRRYDGFCAVWNWRAVPLELSNSLWQTCLPGLPSRLLDSVQNCLLENLPLPWPLGTSHSSSLLLQHLFPSFNYTPSHSIVSLFAYLSLSPVRLWAFCQQELCRVCLWIPGVWHRLIIQSHNYLYGIDKVVCAWGNWLCESDMREGSQG